MRDPITKLSIVTDETCTPAISKALGNNIISSARPADKEENELVVHVVHFAGKVQRKTRGVMGGTDANILVIGDQALYLHKMDGELRRCVPISAIASVHVYPNAHVVLRIPTEFDMVLVIDGGDTVVGFVVNVLTVLQEVLFGRKMPAKRAEGNPLDDKDINLKRPEAFQEVNVPLTDLRVPLLKSDAPLENVIRPNAPAARNMQPLTFENVSKELSPRAKSMLDHPLLASNRKDDDDDETSGSEVEQQPQTRTARRLSVDAPADDSTDNSDANANNNSRAAAAAGPHSPVMPSPTYSPTAPAAPTVLRKPPPLPPGVTPEMARQEEELKRKNEELTRRLKQIEAMQRAVEQQQVQAMEMVDYVSRVTGGKTPSKETGGGSGGKEEDQQQHDGDDGNDGAAPLPGKIRDVHPAPPSLLSEPRRSPPQQQQQQTEAATLSAYYSQAARASGLTPAADARLAPAAPPTRAAAAAAALVPAAPSPPPALSQQDLQDEVVRRVRTAEEMFAARPPTERSIFRRFHIEQRQRYLSELQAAVANPGVVKAPVGSFAHFNFGGGGGDRPFPLSVDVFLTQQELLYLLRIAQAEAPQNPAGGMMAGTDGEAGWSAAAGDNVFASSQQYAVPAHDPAGGPLEPLAAHSPTPGGGVPQQDPYQQQQPAAAAAYAGQQQQQQQKYGGWQQPAQPGARAAGSPQPRQPRHGQPVQPVQPVQPTTGSRAKVTRRL